jgi:hypothetical protein
MSLRLWVLLAALPCVLAAPAAAEPYAVGEKLTAFTLDDQHGEPHSVDASVDVILFSRDMDGGEVLKQGLEDAPEGYLAERKAAYVADISGMPALVARLFAVPSMRRRPYPMLLDRDGATTARLPDAPARATLIFCDDLTVTRIVHFDAPAALRAALDGGGESAP